MARSNAYMTPTEFLDLCLRIGVEVGYWAESDVQHPEDLGENLKVIMHAVGATASHIVRKDDRLALVTVRGEAADARP